MTYSSIGVSIPQNVRPFYGFMQPANGSRYFLDFMPMKGQAKKRKFVGVMRQAVAQNVRRLIDHHYEESRNKPKALAEATGLTLSSVQRVLAADVGASIDTIEAIANVFDLAVYQLVLPNLDVENPQVVAGASSAERALYLRLRNAMAAGRVSPKARAPVK